MTKDENTTFELMCVYAWVIESGIWCMTEESEKMKIQQGLVEEQNSEDAKWRDNTHGKSCTSPELDNRRWMEEAVGRKRGHSWEKE